MELVIILFLVLLNGLFAMSEMAVVSSRKVRLQHWADEGRSGAKAALALANQPANFLSTIQVGITVIGITSGAFAEATLAKKVELWISQWPLLAARAEGIADATVIIGITAASVVIGELVPKRLALLNPEAIASAIAAPMRILSRIAYPLVRLLSLATELVLSALRVRSTAPQVTEEDIKGLMEQGTQAGVFAVHEQALVTRAFRLDQLRVSAVMTPRRQLVCLDARASPQANLQRIVEAGYSRYPVLKEDLETIEGLVHAKTLLAAALSGKPMRIEDHMVVPFFVRSSTTVMELIELFRKERQTMALVIGDGGNLLGLVTLRDIIEALAGEVATVEEGIVPDITKRPDGSWLIGGMTPVARMKEALGIDESLPGEDEAAFHSVGGFVMHQINRVPAAGERFDCIGWQFEVLDMDQRRVDKVLARPARAAALDARNAPLVG
jgi:putative hemolysin